MKGKTTMKKTILGGIAAIGIAGAIATGIGAGTANATPASSIVNDPSGVAATCAVVAKGFTGNVVHDGQVALGVARAIAEYYAIPIPDAVQVENAQVEHYCPQYWPNLVSVGAYYRAADGKGSDV
jgi:hypothetical protein